MSRIEAFWTQLGLLFFAGVAALLILGVAGWLWSLLFGGEGPFSRSPMSAWEFIWWMLVSGILAGLMAAWGFGKDVQKHKKDVEKHEVETVLAYLDSKGLYRGNARSLQAWRYWDERARVLLRLGRYEDGLDSLATAKKGELWELRHNEASQDDLSIVEETRGEEELSIRKMMRAGDTTKVD